MKGGDFYCYILKNGQNNRTYNGYTVDPKRRIRQHNQELVGGAKFTKQWGDKDWEMYVLVTGFPNDINALQCEWRIKHPNGKKRRPKRYNSPEGRIMGLCQVLKLDRWTSRSTHLNSESKFHVWIKRGFEHLLFDLPSNVTVQVCDDTIDLHNLNF